MNHIQNVFLKKKYNFFRLTPLNEKLEIFRSMGINFVINLKFNDKLSIISANEFLDNFLVKSLKVRHVVTGFDFVFGNKQKGNVSMIKKFSEDTKKFKYTCVSEFKKRGLEISSSNIRKLLKSGNLSKANFLLSRNWKICSRVVQGEKKAREIGFKTANLNIDKYSELCFGVYEVSIFIEEKKSEFLGIANYGIKPTFNKKKPLLEIHIFNFNKEIYGKKIYVTFKKFIRNEKKFDTVAKLKEQITNDIKKLKKENEKFF